MQRVEEHTNDGDLARTRMRLVHNGREVGAAVKDIDTRVAALDVLPARVMYAEAELGVRELLGGGGDGGLHPGVYVYNIISAGNGLRGH